MEGGRGPDNHYIRYTQFLKTAITMGKGPGSLLKDSIALAMKHARDKDDKILMEANEKTAGYCVYEKEVRRLFLLQDYSEKSTDKYLRQWCELDMASKAFKGQHLLIIFYPSDLDGGM